MDEEQLAEQSKKFADQVIITSQCLSCGIHYSESFSFYKEHEFNCPECGGPIDDSPIIAYAQEAIQRVQKMKAEQQNSK